MRKIYSLIAMILAVLLTFSSVGHVFAAEDRELTNDEKAAFIVRDEWTGWVRDFTASLSELDKNATAKIYDGMDFYDMQYRFTEKYKKVPEYLDEDGKPTQKLKDMIKEKRKEINMRKSASGGESSTTMIDWTGVSANSWMSKLPDNRYLNDVNIPGVANTAMAYSEAQATSGDTDNLTRARHIAMFCRQSNSIFYNANSLGYRAFDYGLNYKTLSSGETYATYGYSFAPSNNRVLVTSNIINQKSGTGYGNYVGNGASFVKELEEAVRFLINNPKETVVIALRYVNGGDATIMASLIKEVIEKQTTTWSDGEATNVKLKDYVYVGTTFPKLKDVRKKIVIVSRMAALDIGIPLYSNNTHTSLITSGSVVDGVSMYTENKEFHYTADEKVSHVTNALDTITAKSISTDGKKGTNGAFIYTEGYTMDNPSTGMVQVKPSATAEQVNKTIKAYDFTQGKLVGTVMVDFADADLASVIFKSNP